jgi:hypothetical protein
MNRARLLSFAILLAFAAGARALINPKYTVSDLTRESRQVLVLRAAAPQDGKLAAETTDTVLGDPPSAKALTFDFSEAQDLTEDQVAAAFGGAKTALAVLCVRKEKQDGATVAALQIGTFWMGATQTDDKSVWKLDRDPNDLETVWAGSARQLLPAIRYVLADPAAAFPVASTLKWAGDLSLGKMAGDAYGCLVTDIGLIVLSDGGDRVIRPGTKGATPADATAELGLTSRSKAMAAGDFNGDGRIDLASWDGAKLRWVLRGADGKFATPSDGAALPECLSLTVLGGELVVGTAKGVTLVKPDGTARELAGPGGPCVVADFDNDGAPDVLQVSAAAIALRSGARDPVVTAVPVVRNPRALACGDYDTDGQLDIVVAGEGGAALLTRDATGRWTSALAETGELGAANSGETPLVAACPTDLNGDGRQAVALFGPTASPGLFFNRGFACFGAALSLKFADLQLPSAQALGQGQAAGMVADLNGDLAPDLLAADRQRGLWAMLTESPEPRRFALTASLADGARDPLTVTVVSGGRALGLWVIRPGEPVALALPKAGKTSLKWKTADGKDTSRDVVVLNPTRVVVGS